MQERADRFYADNIRDSDEKIAQAQGGSEAAAAETSAAAAPSVPTQGPSSFEFVPFLPDVIPTAQRTVPAVTAEAAGAPSQHVPQFQPAAVEADEPSSAEGLGPSFEQVEATDEPQMDDGGGDLPEVQDAPIDDSMELDLIEDERDLRQVILSMEKAQRVQAKETFDGVISLVSSLCQNGRKYRREATRRLRAIVSEVYSAPRVTDAARRHPRLGCIPGFAMDITGVDDEGNQWNFDLPEMREKAEKQLDAQRPTLLVGSPMCTPFSNLQNLNDPKRDPEIVAQEKEAGRRHLA